MNTRWLAALTTGLTLTSGALTTVPAFADDEDSRRYAVTITNLTHGQLLAPPVVIVHSQEFTLFTPGEPARPELAWLAEDGMTQPLVDLLATEQGVYQTHVGGFVPPGESTTVEVEISGPFRLLTAAGMLATTNDGFYAIEDIKVSEKGGMEVDADAYDAGSEANNESCAFIPGPPCGHPGVRDTVGAEGFVHIHAGIHGLADLVPATHDWRNPVAQVTIERIR
ncbi:MAG TPA: spondin domain-containing protein [Nitrospiria bacterium]|nr:spondin domain-containing protein [Nitrospiria bacterium]